MDLATAQTHLDAWLAADLAIAVGGKSATVGDKTLTRVDADLIRAQISHWQRVVDGLTAQAAGAKNSGIRLATWTR
jgi:hypothetical protein